MRPEIRQISEITPQHSVVYLTRDGEFPGEMPLTEAENSYAKKRFKEGDDLIHINSYTRSSFIVIVKRDLPAWRILEETRKAACQISDLMKKTPHEILAVAPLNVAEGVAEAFVEGLLLYSYSFSKYKTIDKKPVTTIKEIVLTADYLTPQLRWIEKMSDAVIKGRDLINEPVITMNTATFVKEVESMGREAGFRTEVLGKTRIESLRMGGLLGVNRGSIDPPAFMILEWKPAGSVNIKPLVLVGKGVVFDTGGMSLKTGNHMEGMKSDMAGAATVASVMYALANGEIPLHTIALIPLTDNRVTGNPLVPGDIITMHNGMSVEVINTDAEGRLILADALSYSELYSPMMVVSVATLTGSAAATFGTFAAAMMGNAREELFSLLEETGMDLYERVAKLPFWHEYGEAMKSDIADLKNVDNRDAGAIKAGKFLEYFVKAPFIHLDIAGPAMIKKDDYYRKKEGPAYGVRLLAEFSRRVAERYGENADR